MVTHICFWLVCRCERSITMSGAGIAYLGHTFLLKATGVEILLCTSIVPCTLGGWGWDAQGGVEGIQRIEKLQNKREVQQ